MPTKPFFIRLEKKRKDLERSKEVSILLRNTSIFAGASCVLLALISWFSLGVLHPAPLLLVGLGISFGINAALLHYLQNGLNAYLLGSVITFIQLIWLSVFTGGVASPFISFFALLVFSGYLVKTRYGNLYLGGTILGVALIYVQQQQGLMGVVNSVPQDVIPLFSALVFLVFLLLLGGVLGRSLVKGIRDLYQSKEMLLQRAEEKDMLLKEVHHRVKNNLQTVSSLLRMQGRSIEDPQTLKQIRSSQNRVVCMAMVHEMLYMREDLSCIEYSTYVQQLADYLVKSVRGSETDIRLKIDIPEIELGIDTALPLGLLINEAVTNALKYGFEGRESGEISISLEKEDEQGFVLRIGDDGIGYPDNMDYKASKSLGLKLIHNLSRQLKGSVIRDLSKRGTYYIIRFKEVQQDPFHSLA